MYGLTIAIMLHAMGIGAPGNANVNLGGDAAEYNHSECALNVL